MRRIALVGSCVVSLLWAHGCGGGDAAVEDATVLPPPGPPAEGAPPAPPAPPGPTQPDGPSGPAVLPAVGPRIEVSFLTGAAGAEGEWVSTAEFTRAGAAGPLRIRARAQRVDASGNASPMLALWDSNDLLSLSARHAQEVVLTVLRTGSGTLVARDRGGSRSVAVVVSEEAGVWSVRVFQ